MRKLAPRGLGIGTLLAMLFAVAAPAHAQDRIEPAAEIRVLEFADGSPGRASRVVVEDLTPAEILRIQVGLARAGFDPQSRSGVLDERTRKALISFQSARGLEICGCVTYETVIALGIAPKVVARIAGTGGVAASTVIVDRHEPIVIFVPGHFHHRHFGFGGPAVVVGHEPAVGAGQLFRRRFPSRPERGDVRPLPSLPGRDPRPIPPPPGTGSLIRPGDPSSGGLRPARPRP